MAKRNRLEVIRDILKIVQNSHEIRPTPLLRRSNISSSRFKEYYKELLEKELINEVKVSSGKIVKITEKGNRFLAKYVAIVGFIDEFDL